MEKENTITIRIKCMDSTTHEFTTQKIQTISDLKIMIGNVFFYLSSKKLEIKFSAE